MSYSNGVVLAPVGMGDISSAVGSSSLDIGTLVQATDASIKWPKYKPMRGMNDPGVWQKRGDTYNYYPAYLGYGGIVTGFNIGGVSARVIKVFGMIVPMIINASQSISSIISRLGTTGWNWDKNSVDAWNHYRMLDFDGYKPSASFPLEYWQNNQVIDPATTSFLGGGRHVQADYSQQDSYRLFAGDIGQFFNNKVVWASVVQFTNKFGQYQYTSPICYTNDNGEVNYFHQVMPEAGFPNGYADIVINLGAKLSNLNGHDYGGGSGKMYTFAYIPPNSGTGYDDQAILLPSNGGLMTTNPASFTISETSVADVLAQLNFNVANGYWGRAIANATESFPSGYPGYTLQNGTGIYAGSAFYRSFTFSLTLRNTTSNNLTLNLSRIVWDVSIVSYDPSSYATPLTTDSHRSAGYYNSQGTSISSITINANSSATIYITFSNLWEDLTASYYNNTGNYAVWMSLNIVNLDNPNHQYSGGTAQFFAKYENQAQTVKFNWTWDGNGPKKS